MRKDLAMRSPKLFDETYSRGRSTATADLVLYFLRRDPEEATRVGFSIGRKVGNAVVRNKLKRRLRAIVAGGADDLRPGYFLVFIVRPKAAHSAFADLRCSVQSLLRTAGAMEDRTSI